MPPVGFEPTISAGEWPQTYALDRTATGTGKVLLHTDIKVQQDYCAVCVSRVFRISITSLCERFNVGSMLVLHCSVIWWHSNSNFDTFLGTRYVLLCVISRFPSGFVLDFALKMGTAETLETSGIVYMCRLYFKLC